MRLITEKIELRSPYRDYYTGTLIKTSSKAKMFDHNDDPSSNFSNTSDYQPSSRKNIRFVIR